MQGFEGVLARFRTMLWWLRDLSPSACSIALQALRAHSRLASPIFSSNRGEVWKVGRCDGDIVTPGLFV